MKCTHLLLIVALLAACHASITAQETFSIGEPSGTDGRTQIADFRGQPVLFAYWRNSGYAMDAATRAVKLHKKYGPKGLVVILVDSGAWVGPDAWARSRAFLLDRFPGLTAWSAGNLHLPASASDAVDPASRLRSSGGASVTLIGVDGKVVLKGANRGLGGKLEKGVIEELRKAKKGWGTEATAVKTRALAFGKGDLAGAARLAAEMQGEAAAAFNDVKLHFNGRLRTIEYLSMRGLCTAALERTHAVAAAVRGYPAWEQAVARVQESVAKQTSDASHSLEKQFVRFARTLRKGKASAGTVKKLRRFAQECESVPLAKASRRLLALAQAMTE